MAYEYKSVCVKTANPLVASYKGFNEDIQNVLNQYSRDGWKLHTAKLENFSAGPGMVCLLIFEKEK
ncbi:MAG TPA: hypothetical protein DEF61_01890 [Firmicutes bacterium]|nr:hypothetical protein [Bacillota bacterium]HBM70957.1 hypothetical protein [Bacillota bacterium]HBX25025.1 hypothetical protein [Bacillota bacterium]